MAAIFRTRWFLDLCGFSRATIADRESDNMRNLPGNVEMKTKDEKMA